MKTTVLVENLTYRTGMLAEHGLAFHIEADGINILYDTGQTNAFIHNAKELNINLEEVDVVVISHGHYDHIGGINDFLRLNKRAKVFIKRNAFDEKYHGTLRYIGSAVDCKLAENRLVFIDQKTELTDNLFIITDVPILYPDTVNIKGFTIKNESKYEQDWFDDELFIAVKRPEGITVVSSCSHRGIPNIIEAAQNQLQGKVNRVIGGIHLNNGPQPTIDQVIEYFKGCQLESLHVNHCTGVNTYSQLLQKLSCKVDYFSTGMHLDI